MKSAKAHVVVLMTVPDADTGARIGKAAVEGKLAACASVVPGLRSIYAWKVCYIGIKSADPEALVIFKTRRALLPRLEKLVRSLHPYEVFELVALPIAAGHAPYLAWIDASVRR